MARIYDISNMANILHGYRWLVLIRAHVEFLVFVFPTLSNSSHSFSPPGAPFILAATLTGSS